MLYTNTLLLNFTRFREILKTGRVGDAVTVASIRLGVFCRTKSKSKD